MFYIAEVKFTNGNVVTLHCKCRDMGFLKTCPGNHGNAFKAFEDCKGCKYAVYKQVNCEQK